VTIDASQKGCRILYADTPAIPRPRTIWAHFRQWQTFGNFKIHD